MSHACPVPLDAPYLSSADGLCRLHLTVLAAGSSQITDQGKKRHVSSRSSALDPCRRQEGAAWRLEDASRLCFADESLGGSYAVKYLLPIITAQQRSSNIAWKLKASATHTCLEVLASQSTGKCFSSASWADRTQMAALLIAMNCCLSIYLRTKRQSFAKSDLFDCPSHLRTNISAAPHPTALTLPLSFMKSSGKCLCSS